MVFNSMLRRYFSSTLRRWQLPVLESQLMKKMQDKNFSQFGLKIDGRAGVRLWEDLSLIKASYLISNDNNGIRESSISISNAWNYTKFRLAPTSYSPDYQLETLVSGLIVSLHYFRSGISPEIKLLDYILCNIYDTTLVPRRDYHKKFPLHLLHDLEIEELRNVVVNTYFLKSNETTPLIGHSQHDLVEKALFMIKQFCRQHRIHEDLPLWLQIICIPTISQVVELLGDNISSIPSFIVRDALLRQPRNKNDVTLLIELYLANSSKIPKLLNTEIPLFVINIIHGCISFGPQHLLRFLKRFINSGLKLNDEQSISFINKLVYLISDLNVEVSQISNYFSDLLSCQTYLLLFLSKRAGLQKTFEVISDEGLAGVVQLMELLAEPRAFQFMSLLEQRYDKALLGRIEGEGIIQLDNTQLNYSDTELLQLQSKVIRLKLLLSTNAKTLLKVFETLVAMNEQNQILVHCPDIWLSLAVALRRHGELTSSAATKLWKCYVMMVLDRFDDVKQLTINLKFIATIIGSMNDLFSVLSVLKILKLKKYTLNNSIMENVIITVYKNANSPINRNVKIYKDALSYARHMYSILTKKPSNVVSSMLLGEALINPTRIYNLYFTELQSVRKTEGAIRALCIAAIHHQYNSDETLYWLEEKLYRPSYEICVSEVNQYVTQGVNVNSTTVKTSVKFWKIYIELLKVYKLEEELMNLLWLWNDINYVPTEELILELLVNLRDVEARKILKHANTFLLTNTPNIVRSELDLSELKDDNLLRWPWPSEQVYVNHRYEDEHKKQVYETEREKNLESLPLRNFQAHPEEVFSRDWKQYIN